MRQALSCERKDLLKKIAKGSSADGICLSEELRALWVVNGVLDHDLDSTLLEEVAKKFAKMGLVPRGYQHAGLTQP